jgi:hypothetical protein
LAMIDCANGAELSLCSICFPASGNVLIDRLGRTKINRERQTLGDSRVGN